MNFEIQKKGHSHALAPQVALDGGQDQQGKPSKQRDYNHTLVNH